MCVRVLAARFARGFACRSRPSIKRAQGMPGAGWHPRSRVQIVRRRCAHEHTGTAGAARHSLRSGFTAYTVLSLETNSSCLRRRRIEGPANPGWDSQHLRRLDTSNGRQNHTALPSAAIAFVGARPSLTESPPCENLLARPALPRPPLPAPYVRDDRDTPLLWERDGGSCKVDLGRTRSGIFFTRGMDRF